MIAALAAAFPPAPATGFCIGVVDGTGRRELAFRGVHHVGGPAVSANTVWESASLSKPVIALLALMGAVFDPQWLERSLSTSAAEFGAQADPRWSDLTLRHILTHTTGFPNWRQHGQPLSFVRDVGHFGYSGEGFELLLAELVARSGASAATLLAEHLRRLGMDASSFLPAEDGSECIAVGHGPAGEPVPGGRVVTPRGSGSLHATASDYLDFLALVARPEHEADEQLSEALERMVVPQVEVQDGTGRTFGWAIAPSAFGRVVWQHGDNPGFKHIAAARPSTGEAVVVFTNSDAGQALCSAACAKVLQVDVWSSFD